MTNRLNSSHQKHENEWIKKNPSVSQHCLSVNEIKQISKWISLFLYISFPETENPQIIKLHLLVLLFRWWMQRENFCDVMCAQTDMNKPIAVGNNTAF